MGNKTKKLELLEKICSSHKGIVCFMSFYSFFRTGDIIEINRKYYKITDRWNYLYFVKPYKGKNL